jgi:integrase/recombinase XerC
VAVDRAPIGRYLSHLSIERRLSPHTDSNYRRDLLAFADWCDGQQLPDWTTIDAQHVRVHAARCHRDGLAPRSIQRRLSAMRGYFNFLIREGVLRQNPAADVRAPKAPKRLPKALDVDRMGRLLQKPGAAPAPRARAATGNASPVPPAGARSTRARAGTHAGAPPAEVGDSAAEEHAALDVRDLAIMELFYSSGLRLAELVGLQLGDLDLKDRTVRVLGKGSKTRIVPVGRQALAALQAWLAERAAIARPDERAVFVGRNGRRLGARAVQLRVAEFAKRRGIDVKVHPHLFRHSFATHLLESSQDLRGVQELLGHANISTTQVYTHLDFQHLARIYDQAHPRAKRRREK